MKFYPIWGRMGLEIEVEHEHSLDVPLHCQTLSKSYNHLKTSDRLKSMHNLWPLGRSKLTFVNISQLLFHSQYCFLNGTDKKQQGRTGCSPSTAMLPKVPKPHKSALLPLAAGSTRYKPRASIDHCSTKHKVLTMQITAPGSLTKSQTHRTIREKTHQHEHNAHIAVPSQARGLHHASI